jgi:WD40 repeat protein
MERGDKEPILKLDTKGHTSIINDIIVTKDRDIITASDDKTIRVWDSETGEEKRKILGQIGDGPYGMIYAIALTPDSRYLAVGGFLGNDIESYGSIRIYNYKTGELIKLLKSHKNIVDDLAFSSDGKYLISSSFDKTAKIWRVSDFKLIDTIKFHNRKVKAVKIIKKGREYFTVTAGYDKKIALYSLKDKKVIKSHKLPFILDFLATSKKDIAVSGFGNEIRVYNYNLDLIN